MIGANWREFENAIRSELRFTTTISTCNRADMSEANRHFLDRRRGVMAVSEMYHGYRGLIILESLIMRTSDSIVYATMFSYLSPFSRSTFSGICMDGRFNELLSSHT